MSSGAITLTHPGGRVETIYAPTPKQLLFHASNVPNLIMEGARGTGKSLALRMDAHMRALAVPGFRYIIMRRNFPDLRRTHLVHVPSEMQKFGGTYLKTTAEAHYPNGSLGQFGHIDQDDDVNKYLSAEYHLIVLDEIVTFPWDVVMRVAASARVTKGSKLTPLLRGATNPLGVSADEVCQYFITKDVDLSENPDYNPADWHSIHLTLEDNPHLDTEAYTKRLLNLPEAYRKAWLYGEWGIEGAYFNIEAKHLLTEAPTFETPNQTSAYGGPVGTRKMFEHLNWLNVYRVLDWGWHDPTVCLWVAVLPNGREIPFKERTWIRTPAQQVAADIAHDSSGMHVVTTIGDPTLWNGEREMNHCMADVFESAGLPMTKAKNDRVATGFAIQNHLNTNLADGAAKCLIYEPGCPTLVRALRAMRVDSKHPGRIADHKLDHLPICLGYFCMAGVGPTLVANAQLIPRWMQKTGNQRKIGSESVRHR